MAPSTTSSPAFTGTAARYAEHSEDVGAFSMDEVSFDAASLTPTQVLLKVVCAAANVVDIKVMHGALKGSWHQDLPFTPGYDLSGVVVATGEAVSTFAQVRYAKWGM